MYVEGKEVPNPCAAIRLFALCDAMKWAHLPVAGGIYDQDPKLMDQFRFIFGERAKQQEKERKQQDQQMNKRSSNSVRHRGAW